MNPLENMKIRPLKKEDLGAIIEIDEKVLGKIGRIIGREGYHRSVVNLPMFH